MHTFFHFSWLNFGFWMKSFVLSLVLMHLWLEVQKQIFSLPFIDQNAAEECRVCFPSSVLHALWQKEAKTEPCFIVHFNHWKPVNPVTDPEPVFIFFFLSCWETGPYCIYWYFIPKNQVSCPLTSLTLFWQFV